MNCLRMPVSLDDASAIVSACADPNWRANFVLGLGVAATIVVLLAAVAWALRR